MNEDEPDASTANFVYLRSEDHAWIPAKVVEHPEDSDEVTVKIPLYRDERRIVSDGGRTAKRFETKTISLSEYSNHALPLQNVDENGNLLVVEDMVDLAFLHEVGGGMPIFRRRFFFVTRCFSRQTFWYPLVGCPSLLSPRALGGYFI